MTETLQEFVDSRGLAVRVDRAAGVIRGVKLLGLKSRNGRRYLPEALASAAALYEGAKVNLNHPKGHPQLPRDYQDRIGLIRNVRVHGKAGLFGDFQFNPKHALAEQLVWDAEHAPENVGFSHNVEARTTRRGDQVVVEAITRVQSVDLVADPATTRGLFEATATDELAESADVDRREPEELTESTEQAGEIRRLREENNRLAAENAFYRRRQLVRDLLAEFSLPDPELFDPATRRLLGDAFIESVLAATDEADMRRLVEQRATTVRQLRRSGTQQTLPRSREQALVEIGTNGAATTEQFVKAIT